MESNYSNRDFERYVKENADQYRMFPSEKVWKGVNNALHTRRRWYGLGLAFLLLITGGAVTLVMKSYPVSKKQDLTAVNPTTLPAQETQPKKPTTPEDIQEILAFERQTVAISADAPALKTVDHSVTTPYYQNEALVKEDPITVQRSFNDHPAATNLVEEKQLGPAHRLPEAPRPAVFVPDPSLLLVHHPSASDLRPENPPAEEKKKVNAPVTFASEAPAIEDVVNSYKAKPKRVSWQVFVTPTVSYRRLSENKSFSGSVANSIYPFATLDNVNKAVTHKPDLGLQLGVMARYPVTRNLKLRAGMQFNVNRYDIKAFAYAAEVAVINLDNGSNTTSAWTQYRSQAGYKSDWLKNFYLSVSVPVGAELTLFGNRNTSFGVAATVQPTYVIRDRAYLISTDFKNYAKIPWLIRHVNMSSGFEAFVNYKTGKHQWQVGPQVRYQMLSSFQNKYPVKENLFDFGVKLGLTLNP